MGKPDALSRRSDHSNGKQDNENIVLLKPEMFTIMALEGLMVEGEEKNIVREIWKKNREGEVEMQVTVAVKELKRGNWNGKHRTHVFFSESGSTYPRMLSDIAKLYHNSCITGHPGR
jgi:hypothetical protein